MQTHSRKHILRHCTCQKHIILKAISSCMAGGKLLLQVMGKGMLLHNFVVIMSNPEDNGCVSISLVYL